MSDESFSAATRSGRSLRSKNGLKRPGAPVLELACGTQIDLSLLKELGRAMLAPDQDEANRRAAHVLESGVPCADLIDYYLPAAAREYGAAWCEDRMSFAEVTIGCARIQSWLRDLDRSLQVPPPAFSAPSVLLVLQAEAYHTLGAMVAMSQFRRLGASVKLALGPSLDTLAAMVQDDAFDLVALSASASERLEKLRLMVNKVRDAGNPVPKIVVGGCLLELEPDAKILTGADFATSSPKEALEKFGLQMKDSTAPTNVSKG